MTIFQRFTCVSSDDQPFSFFDQMLILFLFLLLYIFWVFLRLLACERKHPKSHESELTATSTEKGSSHFV